MANKKVFTNTLAQIGGKVATALISIFLIKILTNYLDLEGYGLYSKIYNYLSIFSVVADLGLYTISVREISKYKNDREKVMHIAGTIITLRTIMGLGIIGVSLLLAAFLPGYNSTVALIGVAIAGVFTLCGLVNSSILSMLQAHLKTEFSFFSTTAGKIVNLLAVLAVVTILLPKPFHGEFLGIQAGEWSLVLVLLAGLLGNCVMTGMLYLYWQRLVPVRFFLDITYMKQLIRETLPYGLALFLNVVFFKVDVVLLSLLTPPQQADTIVALYSLPMKIVEVGMMFGTVFLNSMLPLFSEALHTKQSTQESLIPLVHKAYRILLFFWVGTAVFLALKSEAILHLIANASYLIPVGGQNSADALKIVSFIFLFYFISSLFTYLLIASGKQARLLKINGWIALVNLLANALIIPVASFIGSAWVTLVTQMLLLAYTVRGTRDITRYHFAPRFTAAVLILALIGGGAVLGLSQLPANIHAFFGSSFFGYACDVALSWWVFLLIYGGGVALLNASHILDSCQNSSIPKSSTT